MNRDTLLICVHVYDIYSTLIVVVIFFCNSINGNKHDGINTLRCIKGKKSWQNVIISQSLFKAHKVGTRLSQIAASSGTFALAVGWWKEVWAMQTHNSRSYKRKTVRATKPGDVFVVVWCHLSPRREASLLYITVAAEAILLVAEKRVVWRNTFQHHVHAAHILFIWIAHVVCRLKWRMTCSYLV